MCVFPRCIFLLLEHPFFYCVPAFREDDSFVLGGGAVGLKRVRPRRPRFCFH